MAVPLLSATELSGDCHLESPVIGVVTHPNILLPSFYLCDFTLSHMLSRIIEIGDPGRLYCPVMRSGHSLYLIVRREYQTSIASSLDFYFCMIRSLVSGEDLRVSQLSASPTLASYQQELTLRETWKAHMNLQQARGQSWECTNLNQGLKE